MKRLLFLAALSALTLTLLIGGLRSSSAQNPSAFENANNNAAFKYCGTKHPD